MGNNQGTANTDADFLNFLRMKNQHNNYFRKTGADLSISGQGLVGVVNVGGRYFLVGELQRH